ncbi:MAG: FtsX-like permease family protein [Dorea sp.]
MSSPVYFKLALTNLKNNRKTYIPYLLASTLTVMMYYIICALAGSENIDNESLRTCLNLAARVMVIFAVIFLFYTNSFLIKRRKKEIGVYNILGMGKIHIAKMLCIETLCTAVFSIAAGLISGTLFGKLMYLILRKMIHGNQQMQFELSIAAMEKTLLFFVAIFAATLLYNLLQIRLANPVELLAGSSQGEKEPKTKALLAIFGAASLGTGYYIAVTTESPLKALTLFFVAVVLVILGTYALFIAGSIAFLKFLKKRKTYYYKARHFTVVSGMLYRMKQNAAGLASICILSTIVLVMISTSVSLYVGVEDVLHTRFPKEVEITKYKTDQETETEIQKIAKEECKQAGTELSSVLSYHMGALVAIQNGNTFELTAEGDYSDSAVCDMKMIPLDDYNQMEDRNVTLSENEVLVYSPGDPYKETELVINGTRYQVAEELPDMQVEKKNKSRIYKGYYVIFPNTEQIEEILTETAAEAEGMLSPYLERLLNIQYVYAFDIKGEKNDIKKAENAMGQRFLEVADTDYESREFSRESFYSLYGGLLFIGIYLGMMFLLATVLIIYYKQISEGYDDRERYQIMQQVGMSKREVRRSIQSQVLNVFFLPLVTAVIHIAFAFKVITKLLAVLNLTNVSLFLNCTIVTVAVFAVFYAIVYSLTAREYYKIVN